MACTGGWCGRHWEARFSRAKSGGTGGAAAWPAEGTHRTDASADVSTAQQRHRLIGSGCAYAASIRIIRREATVRRYVQVRKRELGLSGREVFVPRATSWARKLRWIGSRVWPSWWRSCEAAVLRHAQHGLGRRLHRAYRTHATGLLEAHEHAFDYFGGVSKRCATTHEAVVKRFFVDTASGDGSDDRVRSHWGYQSEYCNPPAATKKAAWKASWDGPAPTCCARAEASDLERIEPASIGGLCSQRSRTIVGRSMTIGAAARWNVKHCHAGGGRFSDSRVALSTGWDRRDA